MQPLNPKIMTTFYPTTKDITLSQNYALQLKRYFIYLVCISICFATVLSIHAQGITINKRSSLVMNGNISMVINNATFNNNGTFTASTSTVSFNGNTDTLASYVSGTNRTTFYNLTANKSAFGVALKSPVDVRNVLGVYGGNLYTDSNLTLKSDAGLTARVDVVPAASDIIGKAQVERYVPARRAWRLMTAPVTQSNTIFNTWQNRGVYTPGIGTLVSGINPTGANGNGLDVSQQNNTSVKIWNATTQTLTAVSNTYVALSPNNNGRADNIGYFVFVRGDRNPINTYIGNTNITTITSIGKLQTGTQSFTASSATRGYTLIGNPYASPIDFSNVTRSNVIKRIYVWDPKINDVGGYVMMDDLNNDGDYTTTLLTSTQTHYIQSSQAFYIETYANGPASITFNETSKSGNNNNAAFRPVSNLSAAGAGTGQIRAALYLLNNDNTKIIADGVIAEFDNIYSASVDGDDALKFGNVNETLGILCKNTSLAAERRPALKYDDTVFFKLTKTVQRNYQFEFTVTGLAQPGMIGMLQDSYLNTNTPVDLSGTTIVNFTINGNAASAAASRFRIVFETSITLPVTITNIAAYQKNKNIAVDWKVANEINMVKYDVEKSTNGSVFTKVGTVNVSGTNNTYNSYSWLDVNAVQGNNFYRIKTYDNSGQVKYSSIVKVAIGKSEGGFSIYPNPVKGNVINLQMTNQPADTYQVRLTNAIGQVLYTTSIQSNGGNSSHALNVSSKLAAGIYQLEIIGQDNNHNTQKVIVE